MPMAPMLAASAASDISSGWIFRGLPGFFLRIRGSTRRSSICSLLVSSQSRDFLEDKTRRARAVRPGQRRREAPGFGPLERQRRDEPALCGGRASRAFFSYFLLLGLFFASCREQVSLRRRDLRRGRGRFAVGAVFRLQASKRFELALAGRIGLAHAEHFDHVGGPQALLDGALDVAECVGRIAVARPTKRLVEKDHLVGFALEEGGIVPIFIVMRNMPECIAESLVEGFAEGGRWKLVGDELHQRVGEFGFVLGAVPLRRDELLRFKRRRREGANKGCRQHGSFSSREGLIGKGGLLVSI